MLNSLKNKAYQTLRDSEGFFKADMVYLAKGGFWQTFGQASSGLFSLILILAFANLLPKETYGVYRYILSISGVLSIFTLNGMNRAVIQAVAANYDGSLKSAVKYQLRWGIVHFLSFLSVSIYYLQNNNLAIAESLFIIGLAAPLTASLNTYGAYLEGKREFRLNNIFSTTSTLVYVAGMLLAIFLSGEVVWLSLVYSLTTITTTAFFYFQTLRAIPPTNSQTGDVISYGKKLTFIGVISPIATQIDSIILAHFWGATQLAAYSIAMAIPVRANSFVKSLVDISLPKLVSRTQEDIERIFLKRILQGLLIGSICAIAYILSAPLLFKYLIPQYLDSVFYSQFLSISLIFSMPNRYLSLLFESRKFSRLIFTNQLVVSIMRIALYIAFGIWKGIFGLVLSYVLISFLGMLVNLTAWKLRDSFYRKFGTQTV